MQFDYNIICKSSFKCTKRWSELAPVDGDPKIRLCRACNSPVHLTSNYEELQANIGNNRCIATFFETEEDVRPEFMGFVMPLRAGAPKWFNDILVLKLSDMQAESGYAELSQNILNKLVGKMYLLGDLVPYTKCQLAEEFGLTVSETLEVETMFGEYEYTLGEKLENWEIESAKYRLGNSV